MSDGDTKFQAELHLLLGRLDGKMDMLLTHQQAHSAKLDDVEKRVTHTENRLTTLEADKANNKSNKSFMVSIVSVLIAVASAAKDFVLK